ncbi:hypothetical protein ASF40_16885 [Microbacterium sp. Leaf288]|nr:hypothetical protein ASF40_16885 [Microbacterium sp. Leaf288]
MFGIPLADDQPDCPIPESLDEQPPKLDELHRIQLRLFRVWTACDVEKIQQHLPAQLRHARAVAVEVRCEQRNRIGHDLRRLVIQATKLQLRLAVSNRGRSMTEYLSGSLFQRRSDETSHLNGVRCHTDPAAVVSDAAQFAPDLGKPGTVQVPASTKDHDVVLSESSERSFLAEHPRLELRF